jgi:hypothetical protein
MKKSDRKKQIMTHALQLSRKVGYINVRRDALAQEAGVANGLVSTHWNTMAQLKKAIMREAIHTEDLVIISQGIAMQDRYALKAPEELRKRAIAQLG